MYKYLYVKDERLNVHPHSGARDSPPKCWDLLRFVSPSLLITRHNCSHTTTYTKPTVQVRGASSHYAFGTGMGHKPEEVSLWLAYLRHFDNKHIYGIYYDAICAWNHIVFAIIILIKLFAFVLINYQIITHHLL